MSRYVSFWEEFTEFVFSLLLICSLVLVLVVGGFVLYDALLDLMETNSTVETIMEEMVTELKEQRGKEDKEIEPKQRGKTYEELETTLKTHVERIEAQSKGVIDSNTISFLFVVFSVGLLSGGVYLLRNSQINVDEAKKTAAKAASDAKAAKKAFQAALEKDRDYREKVRNLGSTLQSRLYCGVFCTHLLNTYQAVMQLVPPEDDSRTQLLSGFVVRTREAVPLAHRILKEADKREAGMDEPEHTLLYDMATNARAKLRNFRQQNQELASPINVDDIILHLDQILAILNSSPWVERYEEQMKALLGEA